MNEEQNKPASECISITATPVSRGRVRPEINLIGTETDGKPDNQTICCGYVPVVLMKMFGPTIFCDLRIRANAETCEWIIERTNEKTLEWIEVCRIYGQPDDGQDEDEPK